MRSEEINERIREIEGDDTIWKDEESGKSFPCIGWFWRTVDFDAPDYSFGIIPAGTPEFTISSTHGPDEHGPRRPKRFVGFMENNKWDYPYTRTLTADEWAECKRLIVVACGSPTESNLRAVWDCIGGFAK